MNPLIKFLVDWKKKESPKEIRAWEIRQSYSDIYITLWDGDKRICNVISKLEFETIKTDIIMAKVISMLAELS